MTKPHTARLAIAPDAQAEVSSMLRLLARRPWLIAGRDDAAISVVRRNEAGVRSVLSRLGWRLVVERDLVRVAKTPPARLRDWAVQAPAPLTCAWVFLLAAASEGMPQQVTIGRLVESAKSAGVEAGVPLTGDRAERRAITQAVRELVERGVIELTDGQLDTYLIDDDAPVLLTIFHRRLLHLIAHFDPTTDPSIDPQAWLSNVAREPDAGRRMRRRLVDDTCVHIIDLDEAEADWLSRRLRGDDGRPLAEAFGMVIERRDEGAAFIVPDDAFRWPQELGQVPFPSNGIIPHVAMLLADHIAAFGQIGGPGPRWRGMPRATALAELTALASKQTTGKGGWPADRAADPEGLLVEAKRLLIGAGLLRIIDDVWWLSPVLGRWEAPPTALVTSTGSPAEDDDTI